MELLIILGIWVVCIPFAYVVQKISFLKEMRKCGHENVVWTIGDRIFCMYLSLAGPIALIAELINLIELGCPKIDKNKPAKW